MATPHKSTYQNNPFFIAYNGLQLLFSRAQTVGIFGAILATLGVTMALIGDVVDTVNSINGEKVAPSSDFFQTIPADSLAAVPYVSLIVVSIVLFGLISLFLYGIMEYTAAHLAKGESVTLEQAFHGVRKDFVGYVWLYALVIVKLFLWTLLFIVPGIIKAVRYSLAGTVYFAENKRGNAAIARSMQLTHNAWFTTYAGMTLWNLITFNIITTLVNPAASTILYRQLKEATDHHHKKPAPHWLSWLTFFIPIIFFFLIVIPLIFFLVVLWIAFT